MFSNRESEQIPEMVAILPGLRNVQQVQFKKDICKIVGHDGEFGCARCNHNVFLERIRDSLNSTFVGVRKNDQTFEMMRSRIYCKLMEAVQMDEISNFKIIPKENNFEIQYKYPYASNIMIATISL